MVTNIRFALTSEKTDILKFGCRSVTPDVPYNDKHNPLKPQITKSPMNNRKQWWIKKCKEAEKGAAIGNILDLYE